MSPEALKERLIALERLRAAHYGYDPNNPPRMNKSVRILRKTPDGWITIYEHLTNETR